MRAPRIAELIVSRERENRNSGLDPARAGLELVVSGELLQRLALPPGVDAARRGELAVRGKAARITAYSLTADADGGSAVRLL